MTDQLKKILADEAERLYPYGQGKNIGLPFVTVNGITELQRAAHVACAEKYTAIIEQKDKEIERLQRFVFNVRDWAMPMDYRGIAKMQEIADDVLKANIALKPQHHEHPTPFIISAYIPAFSPK